MPHALISQPHGEQRTFAPPFPRKRLTPALRKNVEMRNVDRSASQTTANSCSTVVFHLPSYEARSSIASRYLSSEEACAERERHKIGNDPARVCAALKLIRYDSQGDRSLSWLAGRDGKSSADGLGQASSNAHCPCWRVQCLINLSVASCNVSTGQNMYPNVLDVCAQRRVTGGSNIQWAHFPRSSLLATEQAGIYNVCAV